MTDAVIYTRDDIVSKYVQIRDEKTLKRDCHKAKMADLSKRLDIIEGYLLADMRARGENSFSTPSGTAFIKRNEWITVADKEVFLAWVRESGDLNFLTVSASKTNCLEHKENTGVLPPGLNCSASLEVGIRRGKSKE